MTVRVRTLTGSAGELGHHYGRLASGHNGGGATESFWFGRGAAALGLDGVPSKSHIRAIMDARHPFTGEKLGYAFRKGKAKERPSARGHDMALSVPKDVSVLWALADRPMCDEIEQAVIAAARAVLGRLDQSPPIRTKGELVGGVGIAVAVIPGHTSLLGDPSLHVRGVISSKIQHPETGRWYALDARELKKHQQAYSALFHRGLEAELSTRLGLGWARRNPESRGFGTPLAGANERVCAAFSGRTIDIDDKYAEKLKRFRAAMSREPSQIEQSRLGREAVDATKPRRHAVDESAARACWLHVASQLTATPTGYSDAIAQHRDRPIEFTAQTLEAAAEAALGELEENMTAWRRGHLVTEIARNLPAGLNVNAETLVRRVDETATDVLAASHVVLVSTPSAHVAVNGLVDPLTTYTTTPTQSETTQSPTRREQT